MTFFVVEMRIYTVTLPARFRLFRPNIPEVPERSRWIHIKVPHPESLVRARPDRLDAGGLTMGLRGADWTFVGDLGVWVLTVWPESEESAKRLSEPLAGWARGRYRGKTVVPYRRPSEAGEA